MNPVELSRRSLRSHAGIVAEVVGMPHEGIHRAESIPLSSGQQHESHSRNSWRKSAQCGGIRCKRWSAAAPRVVRSCSSGSSQRSRPASARGSQPNLAELAQTRTPRQHVVILFLDRLQNRQPSPAEQLQIQGQRAVHPLHQRQPALETTAAPAPPQSASARGTAR